MRLQRPSARSLRPVVAALLAVGVLGGCGGRSSDTSQAGALGADDLGAGEWNGPYDSFDEATPERRVPFCTWGGDIWLAPDEDATAQASAAWESNGVVVWSVAKRFSDTDGAQTRLESARLAESCTAQAEGHEPASFSLTDDGSTILTEDRNEDSGTLWASDVALTTDGTTLVAVMVSYPADAEPPVTAADLLDPALDAAADLPED